MKIVRHISISIFLVLLSFLLSSCDDKNSFGGNYFVATCIFSVTGSDTSIPSTGGTQEIKISSNSDWTATVSEPSWMHLSQTDGNGNIKLTLTADDNPSSESRSNTTEFKVTGSSHSYRIVTEQAGRYLTVDVQSLSFPNIGGERQISVSTDGKYDAKVAEGSWLTVRTDGNVVYVTAEKTESGERRSGKILISLTDLASGTLSRDVVVTQQSESDITVQPFGEDEQWDLSSDDSMTVTLTGFGTDVN